MPRNDVEHPWVFGRLYRVSFLRQQGIEFSKLRAMEDGEFNWKIRMSIEGTPLQINKIDSPIYLWKTGSEHSITRIGIEENGGEPLYNWDLCQVGATAAAINAVKFCQKKNPFNGGVIRFAVEQMIGQYFTYIKCLEKKPMFAKQNFFNAKRFYHFCYKDMEKNIDKNIENFQKLNFAFGHFECNGIELTGAISDGSPYNLSDLFKLSDYVFSGHYHLNKTYSQKHSRLNMVGSPLQLDWGDYNRGKYIYTLDLASDNIIGFANEVNAKFEKVFYSVFLKNGYDEEELSSLCKENFIKFVIDDKYKFEKILSFTEKIKSFHPLNLELDYLVSITDGVISNIAEESIKKKANDNLTYLLEYIEEVGKEAEKVDESIDLNLLKEMTKKYYANSQLTESEKTDIEFKED